jgi:hypothetical protein
MRFGDNFNPEWGYLAPAPRFMRTVRVAVVAAAVGASAGGALVFSLIERPAAEETSVAARTLAEPVEPMAAFGAAGPTTVPAAAELRQLAAPPQVHVDARAANLAAAESSTTATTQRPASAAALAEAPAITEPVPARAAAHETLAANAAPAQRKAIKQQHINWHGAPRDEQAYGYTYGTRAPLALLRAATYPPRGDY